MRQRAKRNFDIEYINFNRVFIFILILAAIIINRKRIRIKI